MANIKYESNIYRKCDHTYRSCLRPAFSTAQDASCLLQISDY